MKSRLVILRLFSVLYLDYYQLFLNAKVNITSRKLSDSCSRAPAAIGRLRAGTRLPRLARMAGR